MGGGSIFVGLFLILIATASAQKAAFSAPTNETLNEFLIAFPSLLFPPFEWKNDTSDACTKWQGITCNDPNNNTVISISFSLIGTNNLTGYLPTSIGNLVDLVELSVEANLAVSGLLPSTIDKLVALESLELRNIDFDAVQRIFPTNYGANTKLKNLAFTNMNFSGAQFNLSQLLPRLESFTFSGVDLEGWPDIGDPLPLITLDMSRNRLYKIPATLGTLGKLQNLDLSFNQITYFPKEIARLTSINSMFVNNNNLTSIADELCSVTGLSHLNLENNFITSIPDCFDTLPNLVTLSLGGNYINDTLPEFLNCTQLEDLNLSYNSLTGGIATLSKCRKLVNLTLSHNLITGDVQDALETLENLTNCDLSWNPELYCPLSFPRCCGQNQGTNATTTTAAPSAATATTAQPTTATTTVTTTVTATTVVNPTDITQTATTTTTTRTTRTTTTGNPEECTGYRCTCSSNLTSVSLSPQCQNGTWIITGPTVNNNTVIVGQGDVIKINGSLTQQSTGVLQIYTNSSASGTGNIIVDGPVNLGGTLIIVVTELSGNKTINILTATNITGNFSSVRIEDKTKSCGKPAQGEARYTSTTVSVLLSKENKSCTNNGKTIGIAVGVSIGAFLILVILVIIILVLLKQRGKAVGLFWAGHGKHSNSKLETMANL